MAKLHSTRSNPAFTLFLLGAGALSIACGAAVGCTPDPQPLPSTTGSAGEGGGGTGGSGGGSSAADRAEELFRVIEPDLLLNCGAAACHGGDSDVNFLAGDDPYKTIQSWRGIVVKDWHSSKILVHPTASGGHAGTNIDSPNLVDTLKPGIEAWLEEEAKTIVGPDPDGGAPLGPGIEPVTPVIGFNALYLGSIDPDFEGMAITFTADELTPNLLQLSDVQIHASSAMGVHVVHPLFVVYPKGLEADPDTVDSCSNVDQSIDVGQTAILGPGTVVLSNWKPEARLGVVFEKIEKYQAGGVVDDGCKDVAAFTANAQGPLQNNCFNCHGGGNGAATGAVSMEDLQNDPAKACAQVMNRVNIENANGSQIFVVTEPGSGANHPYKFNGNAGNYNNFKTAVSVWITAEAAAAAGQ